MCMILVLAVILLPLFRIAHYNFRSVDDFGYAQSPETVWEESHSVIKVLAAQIPYTWDYYHEWQGTFFSEWFTTSMMGIFSKNAYYMGTYFTLGGMVLAELLAFMVILRKVLGADIYRAGIAAISCVSLQVLLTPAPVEAFFWFCGAMLYTFIHALGFLLVTMLVLLYHDNRQKKWKTVLLEAGTILLTIAVSGSNYITALTIQLIYVLCVGWFFYKKHPYKILILINAVVYLAGFLVNVMAPGNSARQNAAGVDHMSAIECIFRALYEAAVYVSANTILPCIIVGLLLLPLFINMVQKKKYRYPLPVLVSFISFGLFAAQFAPTLFALGIIGAGRVQNLYRFNLYVLLFGNEIYWTGWCMNRIGKMSALTQTSESRRSYIFPAWIAGGLILCFTLSVWGGKTVTSYNAVQSLRRGEAQQYRAENRERMKILEDSSIQDARLQPFSVKPYLLYFGDIDENMQDWVNTSMASYFHKNTIGFRDKNKER